MEVTSTYNEKQLHAPLRSDITAAADEILLLFVVESLVLLVLPHLPELARSQPHQPRPVCAVSSSSTVDSHSTEP